MYRDKWNKTKSKKSRRKSTRLRAHISLPLAVKSMSLFFLLRTCLCIQLLGADMSPKCYFLYQSGETLKAVHLLFQLMITLNIISFVFHLSNEGVANTNNFRCQTQNVSLEFRTVGTLRNRKGHNLWKSIQIKNIYIKHSNR